MLNLTSGTQHYQYISGCTFHWLTSQLLSILLLFCLIISRKGIAQDHATFYTIYILSSRLFSQHLYFISAHRQTPLLFYYHFWWSQNIIVLERHTSFPTADICRRRPYMKRDKCIFVEFPAWTKVSVYIEPNISGTCQACCSSTTKLSAQTHEF